MCHLIYSNIIIIDKRIIICQSIVNKVTKSDIKLFFSYRNDKRINVIRTYSLFFLV